MEWEGGNYILKDSSRAKDKLWHPTKPFTPRAAGSIGPLMRTADFSLTNVHESWYKKIFLVSVWKTPCRGQSIYCYLLLTENNPAPAWLLFNCFTKLESCPLSIWNSLIIYWLFLIYWRKFQYCLSWLQGFFSHRQKKSYLSSFHLLLWVIVYRLINSILLVHQSSKGSTSYLAGFTEGEEKKLGLRSILSLPPHPLLQIFVTSSWRHSL